MPSRVSFTEWEIHWECAEHMDRWRLAVSQHAPPPALCKTTLWALHSCSLELCSLLSLVPHYRTPLPTCILRNPVTPVLAMLLLCQFCEKGTNNLELNKPRFEGQLRHLLAERCRHNNFVSEHVSSSMPWRTKSLQSLDFYENYTNSSAEAVHPSTDNIGQQPVILAMDKSGHL